MLTFKICKCTPRAVTLSVNRNLLLDGRSIILNYTFGLLRFLNFDGRFMLLFTYLDHFLY